MKNARLFWNSVLISLPAAMLVGCWAYGIAIWMPKKINKQQMDLGRAYRRAAEKFIRNPGEATDVRTDEPATWGGQRQNKPIDGKIWGRLTEDGRSFVWYQSTNELGRVEWRLKEVLKAPEEEPYELMLYAGGGVVALVLIGLSLLATLYYLRLMRERDDFLAATAHDLTTPLVGMRMMIGRNDEEAKTLNERMLLIVNNIKDFLRLGGKRRTPELKPLDIVTLTKEAYRLFAADYEDSESGSVAFRCMPTPSTYAFSVLADETMTLQILWNLFGNDLKYAAPYGKVSVRFGCEDRFVKVEFVDEGQGMTSQQMKKAFDRYYRARTVLESGKGGFGIGLCTAREFARAMGGDLTVRANHPKGCIFSLLLPASP